MRYFVAILGLILLVAGLVGVKALQIGSLIAFGEEMQKSGPPPEVVGTAIAEKQSWEATLTAVGSVVSVQGVALSNDAPGIVSRLHFESGAVVKKGQVLVELDSNVERAQLASVRARRELAETSVKRSRELTRSGVVAQAQLDTDESSFKSVTADEKALGAQIDRKVVRAPFSGRLGIRAVNLGQYLPPGTTLTVLESTEAVFVDFTLPQQHLNSLQNGMVVRLTHDRGEVLAEGAVSAVDSAVDPVTRTLKVRATVTNAGDKLRPGMFVNVAVVLPQQREVVAVPVTAVIRASYGDSVFCVEPKKGANGAAVNGPDGKPARTARQQFVRIGEMRGDFIAITDGLPAGQEVVTAGAFKLRNNAAIAVNNQVKATPALAPRPANR